MPTQCAPHLCTGCGPRRRYPPCNTASWPTWSVLVTCDILLTSFTRIASIAFFFVIDPFYGCISTRVPDMTANHGRLWRRNPRESRHIRQIKKVARIPASISSPQYIPIIPALRCNVTQVFIHQCASSEILYVLNSRSNNKFSADNKDTRGTRREDKCAISCQNSCLIGNN